MYAALWRLLPGPWWLRVLILLIAVTAVLYALFYFVFPWVAPLIDPGEVDLE